MTIGIKPTCDTLSRDCGSRDFPPICERASVLFMQICLNKTDARSQIGGKSREPQSRESVSHVGLIPIVIDREGGIQLHGSGADNIREADRSGRTGVAT